jgi:anion-transporting  ArsA/GET3 family ATPase
MRYAVVNTKGGVGKTTMACHLAAHLASVSKTLLIDGDTDESAATWAAWRRDSEQFSILPSPNTVRLKGKAISREMKLDVMAGRIAERVAFRRAIGEGAAVHEMRKDPSAIAEMAAFYEEVPAQ